MKIKTLWVVLISASVLLSACEKKTSEALPPTSNAAPATSTTSETTIQHEAADAWWASGANILAACLVHARELQLQVADFIDAPDTQKLQQSQQTWQKAAIAYRAFYAHHFVALSDPQTFQILAEIDFRIGAWPVQPGSLDSWGSYLYSGLVHDVGNPLTMENLLLLHGQVDSENATLGLYAIEYMLFGENGSRTVDDYVSQNKVTAEYEERGFNSPSELPNNRRRMLLTLQAGKLVEDLELLVNSWNAELPGSQTNVWKALADAKKERVLTSAFERGLAQLLVNDEEAFSDSEQLLIAVEALRPLPGLINHKRAAVLEEKFVELEKVLKEKTANTAEDQADWKQTLGQLTDIARLFAPALHEASTAPQVAESEE